MGQARQVKRCRRTACQANKVRYTASGTPGKATDWSDPNVETEGNGSRLSSRKRGECPCLHAKNPDLLFYRKEIYVG